MADEELNEEDLDIEIDDDEEDANSGSAPEQDCNGSNSADRSIHGTGPLVEEDQPQMASENVQNSLHKDNGDDELNEEDLDIELEDDDVAMDEGKTDGLPPRPAADPSGQATAEADVDAPTAGGEVSALDEAAATEVQSARAVDRSPRRDGKETQDAGTKRSAEETLQRSAKRKSDGANGVGSRNRSEEGSDGSPARRSGASPLKAAGPRKKDTRFTFPPSKKIKVYQPPTDPSAPVRNLYKINLDELLPAEIMSIMSFPKPERGLGSSRKLTVLLEHRRTKEEPFKGDLIAYLSAQMETMIDSQPSLVHSDRFSGLVTLISNLVEIMLHGEEPYAEQLGRIFYKKTAMIHQIHQMIEEYFLEHITAEVPEVSAHDDDDEAAEAERQEQEDKTARMAGNVWRMVCTLHSLVLYEERKPELNNVFTSKLLQSENFLELYTRTIDVLEMPLMKGRWGKAVAGDKESSTAKRGRGQPSEEQIQAMRKALIKHKDKKAILNLLFMKLKGRDKAAMMSLKLLYSLAHSKKFINIMGQSLELEGLREQFVALGLEAAARLATSDDDGAWVELLEVLNMLLVHEAARDCALMSEDHRELVVAMAAQLLKNLDKLCASAVECLASKDDPEDKAVGRGLTKKIQYFFRLLARLAGTDPLNIAALLYHKFGGTEVKDERLVAALNKIVDFEKLGLRAGDEADKRAYKEMAEAVMSHKREELLAYISGAQEHSTKDIKETLDKLQNSELRMAEAAVSFEQDTYEKGLQLIQDGQCVQVEGEDKVRFKESWDKHEKWARRTGGGIHPLPFIMLRRNIYLHRKYAKLSVDMVPVCRCHARAGKGSGRPAQGCTEASCVLRQTFVECTPHVCPCGDACTNQRFQKQQYAAMECKKTPDKRGWGLFAKEFVPKGGFVVEYMGEVVNKKGYEKRKKDYAQEFNTYFMQLSTQPFEMIDASRKSSMGRFLNHSCDPNCETQRWRSLGEPVVGVFATRDIQPDEEFTFDYQMGDGAEQKKCRCKAPNCRGFLGKKDQDEGSDSG